MSGSKTFRDMAWARRILVGRVLGIGRWLLSGRVQGFADYLQDWKRRGPDGVTIHGWVYQLEDGTIRDVNVSQGPPGQVIGKKADVW